MIKLLVPKVPTADALLPYLRRIDESKWYTNFGQLVLELEQRLSRHFEGAHVISLSSCTLGLELVYELFFKNAGHPITLPALTFPATLLAARRAGVRVELCDVDPDTWISPHVAGFGVPVDGSVIDAAAAFGEQKVTLYQTAVFSLHATKPVGAGEGGYIVTWDSDTAEILRSMTNFGLMSTREEARRGFGLNTGSSLPGTNAKMSEYHAAVAHASLDAWDREPWLKLFDWYARHLPLTITQQKRKRGVYPILAVKLPVPVEPVMKRMLAQGIETRRWYYPPLYRHPLMLSKPLPVTEHLSKHLLGLPYHLYLTEDDVRMVCHALRRALEEA